MMTAIAQFVRDRHLGSSGLARRVWSRIERAVVKLGDPLVVCRIGRFSLQIPLSHALPVIQRCCPQYNLNLRRIGAVLAKHFPDLHAIDVGANVGDSVAILRDAAAFPILCAEADSRFFRVLKRNVSQFEDVELAHAYLGESDEEVRAHLDSARGTAKLAVSNGDRVQIQTLSTLLRTYPRFQSAKLLKIDTDGYDNKIIRGATSFLQRAKPVIFFEYDPYFLALQNDDGLSIFELLAGLGYRNSLEYENTGGLRGALDVRDRTAVAEMHQRNSGHRSFKYADLCVFHDQDSGVFEELMRSESRVETGLSS